MSRGIYFKAEGDDDISQPLLRPVQSWISTQTLYAKASFLIR
jgi:hypothetical protein